MPAISENVIEPNAVKLTGLKDLDKLFTNLPSDDKWKVTHFETTPPMSSYIVAYANGPFKHLESSVELPLSKKVIPLRIYGKAYVALSSRDANLPFSYPRCYPSSPIRFGYQGQGFTVVRTGL